MWPPVLQWVGIMTYSETPFPLFFHPSGCCSLASAAVPVTKWNLTPPDSLQGSPGLAAASHVIPSPNIRLADPNTTLQYGFQYVYMYIDATTENMDLLGMGVCLTFEASDYGTYRV